MIYRNTNTSMCAHDIPLGGLSCRLAAALRSLVSLSPRWLGYVVRKSLPASRIVKHSKSLAGVVSNTIKGRSAVNSDHLTCKWTITFSVYVCEVESRHEWNPLRDVRRKYPNALVLSSPWSQRTVIVVSNLLSSSFAIGLERPTTWRPLWDYWRLMRQL